MEPVAEANAAAGVKLLRLAEQLESHSGFAAILASLKAGHSGTLGGVWGSSCALCAAAIERCSPETLVVVLPHMRDIDSFVEDVALFSDAQVDQLPAWETDSGERLLNDEIYGQRVRVLKKLSHTGSGRGNLPRILVTAIQSLMQPVPSRESLVAATRTIRVGEVLDATEFTRWLAEAGCTSTTAEIGRAHV